MKHAAAFTFLALLFCAASASWDSLDSVHLSSELELVNEDIIPRLLQEVLGDAAAPGAYGAATPTAAAVEKATPETPATPAEVPATTTTTPAIPEAPVDTTTIETPAESPVEAATTTTTTPAETPVTPIVQPTQPTFVEAPTPAPAVATAAETTPAAETTTTITTTTTTTDAAAPATVAVIPAEASTCPAGTKRVDYSSGTMFCVLSAQGDAEGEVHISNGSGRAIPSGNKCVTAPCAASPSSSSSTGRKMLRWLKATESAQAQQRAEFLPFLMAIARGIQPVQLSPASTLAHSKCFYVCEAQA